MTEPAPQSGEEYETRPGSGSRYRTMSSAIRLAVLLICVVTVFAFQPAIQNELVDWDDQHNLVRNEAYQGLSPDHLRWMFGTAFAGHYQPLTWFSFALDFQLWGVSAAGFHFTNIVLHVVTAVGFFFVTRRLLAIALEPAGGGEGYGITLGALLAGLLFAVHPLRVESVAWATERRDVLSGVWLMLTMLFYLRAAVTDNKTRYRVMLGLSLLCYILSLLSKAAGIMLPVVLLLLDAYPLRRLSGQARPAGSISLRGLLFEKALFVVPAAIIALIAVNAQAQAGALRSFAEHSIGLRIGQAFHGIVFYPWKTIWPIGLAPLYEQSPDATPWDLANVVSGGLVVVVLSLLLLLRRRRPALLIAFAVYVVLLSPTLGLAQSGPQVVADRYSYLSCMSWAVLLGAGVALGWSRAADRRRVLLSLVSLAVVVVLVFLTRDQTRIWKDSRTLWTEVIRREGSRGIAHANLATVLNDAQEYEPACKHARKALETLPGNRTAHVALGRCSLELGDLETAEEHYAIALNIAATVERTDTATMVGLAIVKTRLGELEEAEQLYRDLVACESDSPVSHYNLAGFLAKRGRRLEAKTAFEEALRLDPGYTAARFRLGVLLLALDDTAAAIDTFEEGLRHAPGDALLSAKLAWVLAVCQDDHLRDGARALELARAAVQRSDGTDPAALEALAAGLAETGDFANAVRTVERLLSDEEVTLPETMIRRLKDQLEHYRRGLPFRE
jgi:tetratricopeptide (TPR) repeat protein